MKYLLATILLCICSTPLADDYEKGQLMGFLGSSALLLDNYDRHCLGMTHSTYMSIAEPTIKAQLDVSFLEYAEKMEQEYGENVYKTILDTLRQRLDQYGGCKSADTEMYIMNIRQEFFRSLDDVLEYQE